MKHLDPTQQYLIELGYDGDNPQVFMDAFFRIAAMMRDEGYELHSVTEMLTMVAAHLERIEQGEH